MIQVSVLTYMLCGLTHFSTRFYLIICQFSISCLIYVLGSNRVLVFVETKRNADFLASYLSQSQFPSTSIHGQVLHSVLKDGSKLKTSSNMDSLFNVHLVLSDKSYWQNCLAPSFDFTLGLRHCFGFQYCIPIHIMSVSF